MSDKLIDNSLVYVRFSLSSSVTIKLQYCIIKEYNFQAPHCYAYPFVGTACRFSKQKRRRKSMKYNHYS